MRVWWSLLTFCGVIHVSKASLRASSSCVPARKRLLNGISAVESFEANNRSVLSAFCNSVEDRPFILTFCMGKLKEVVSVVPKPCDGSEYQVPRFQNK
jgi:hypothetical protein